MPPRPPPPPALSVGAGCWATQRTLAGPSAILWAPKRPRAGEGRGGVPAGILWLPRGAGSTGERLCRSAGPAGNEGDAGHEVGQGAGARDRRAWDRMKAWPGWALDDREARSQRAEPYCYIKVPGPAPPERKTTCVRPAQRWGAGGGGTLRPEGTGPNPASLPNPRRKRGCALSCGRQGGGSGGSGSAGSGCSERPCGALRASRM